MNNLIISCGSALNRENIEQQKDVLNAALDANKNVVLQVKDLVSVDTSGLQLLLSFTQSLEKKNLTWKWDDSSQALKNIANIMGMSKLLKL